MNIIPSPIPDLVILEPKIFNDARGYFFESFNEAHFNAHVAPGFRFVQDNHSHSVRGVIRGLHYQIEQAQGKLVRVVQGAAWDVAVDIRKQSATFGQWFGLELSAANGRMFWVPPGFAHGYLALSETVDFLYKTTDYYAPAHERCIVWNDPSLAVGWPVHGLDVIVNGKDAAAPRLADAALYA